MYTSFPCFSRNMQQRTSTCNLPWISGSITSYFYTFKNMTNMGMETRCGFRKMPIKSIKNISHLLYENDDPFPPTSKKTVKMMTVLCIWSQSPPPTDFQRHENDDCPMHSLWFWRQPLPSCSLPKPRKWWQSYALDNYGLCGFPEKIKNWDCLGYQ